MYEYNSFNIRIKCMDLRNITPATHSFPQIVTSLALNLTQYEDDKMLKMSHQKQVENGKT